MRLYETLYEKWQSQFVYLYTVHLAKTTERAHNTVARAFYITIVPFIIVLK